MVFTPCSRLDGIPHFVCNLWSMSFINLAMYVTTESVYITTQDSCLNVNELSALMQFFEW